MSVFVPCDARAILNSCELCLCYAFHSPADTIANIKAKIKEKESVSHDQTLEVDEDDNGREQFPNTHCVHTTCTVVDVLRARVCVCACVRVCQ